VSDIFSIISENVKSMRDPEHIPFISNLSHMH